MQAQTVKEKIRSQYKWMKLIISKHGKKCSYDKMETSTLFGWPSGFDSENDEPLKQQRKRKREEEKNIEKRELKHFLSSDRFGLTNRKKKLIQKPTLILWAYRHHRPFMDYSDWILNDVKKRTILVHAEP